MSVTVLQNKVAYLGVLRPFGRVLWIAWNIEHTWPPDRRVQDCSCRTKSFHRCPEIERSFLSTFTMELFSYFIFDHWICHSRIPYPLCSTVWPNLRVIPPEADIGGAGGGGGSEVGITTGGQPRPPFYSCKTTLIGIASFGSGEWDEPLMRFINGWNIWVIMNILVISLTLRLRWTLRRFRAH